MSVNYNLFEPYCSGALRAAFASCFIAGRIPEQQIDFVKKIISKFREEEIDQSAFPATKRPRNAGSRYRTHTDNCIDWFNYTVKIRIN